MGQKWTFLKMSNFQLFKKVFKKKIKKRNFQNTYIYVEKFIFGKIIYVDTT